MAMVVCVELDCLFQQLGIAMTKDVVALAGTNYAKAVEMD